MSHVILPLVPRSGHITVAVRAAGLLWLSPHHPQVAVALFGASDRPLPVGSEDLDEGTQHQDEADDQAGGAEQAEGGQERTAGTI